jgi:hypothetical protein
MPTVRPLLRRCTVALLLAAGLLQPWAAPAAQACTVVASPTAKIPTHLATDEDRRWIITTGPDWLEVVLPCELKADSVQFEGIAVATGIAPPEAGPYTQGAPTWTFRVERVLWGIVPPEVVVAGAQPGAPCGFLRGNYKTGISTRVTAWRDPDTGYLLGAAGRFAPPRPDPLTPYALPKWPAGPSGAGLGTWLTLVFLAEIAVLGLATCAGAVYLRARELDLEERELALRERETEARSRLDAP